MNPLRVAAPSVAVAGVAAELNTGVAAGLTTELPIGEGVAELWQALLSAEKVIETAHSAMAGAPPSPVALGIRLARQAVADWQAGDETTAVLPARLGVVVQSSQPHEGGEEVSPAAAPQVEAIAKALAAQWPSVITSLGEAREPTQAIATATAALDQGRVEAVVTIFLEQGGARTWGTALLLLPWSASAKPEEAPHPAGADGKSNPTGHVYAVLDALHGRHSPQTLHATGVGLAVTAQKTARANWGTDAVSTSAAGAAPPVLALTCPPQAMQVLSAVLALSSRCLPPLLPAAPADAGSETGAWDWLAGSGVYGDDHLRPWVFGGRPNGEAALRQAIVLGGAGSLLISDPPEDCRRAAVLPPSPHLYCLAAPDAPALLKRIDAIIGRLRAQTGLFSSSWSRAEGNDLLATRLAGTPGDPRERHRLVVIASSQEDLANKLSQAREKLAQAKRTSFKTRNGLRAGIVPESPGAVAFLFPGQGSQRAGMLREFALASPRVLGWYDDLERTFASPETPCPSLLLDPPAYGMTPAQRLQAQARITSMEGGAQAGQITCTALNDLLRSQGIIPDVIMGHSNGENSALHAAGVHRLDREQMFATMKRLVDAADVIPETMPVTGRTVAVSIPDADRRVVESVLEAHAGELFWAMDNCPRQVVLFGLAEAMEAAVATLREHGALVMEVPFDRPFHTPLFAPQAAMIHNLCSKLPMGPSHTPIYSAVGLVPFPKETADILELSVRQWTERVRFREAVELLYSKEGVRCFVEVGPGGLLTSFVTDTLRGEPAVAVACDAKGRPGATGLLEVLAELYLMGRDPDMRPLPALLEQGVHFLDASCPSPTERSMPEPSSSLQGEGSPGLQCAASPGGSPCSMVEARSSVQTDPGGDGRQAVPAVAEHFSLMQEFLASQRRTLEALAPSGAGQRNAPAGLAVGQSSPEAPRAGAAPSGRRRIVAAGNSPAQAFRLLGAEQQRSEQGVVFERAFDLKHDLFLRDHALGRPGSPRRPELHALSVMPFTFVMEMLAEAASALAGPGWRVVGLRDVRGHRWLALDSESLSLRIAATMSALPKQAEGGAGMEVLVRVSEVPPGPTPAGSGNSAEAGGADALAFSGTIRLERTARALQMEPPQPSIFLEDEAKAPTWSVANFYAYCLFHGPRLQSIKRVRAVSPQGLEAELSAPSTATYFSDGIAPQFLLPPALLDCAGQLAGLWLLEQKQLDFFGAFPYDVQDCTLYGPPPAPGELVRCVAAIKLLEDGRTVEGQFDFLSPSNTLRCRLTGFRLRVFQFPGAYIACLYWPQLESALTKPLVLAGGGPGLFLRRSAGMPQAFLEQGLGIWVRALAHVCLGAREREHFYGLPAKGGRRREWLLGRMAAKDAVREYADARLGVKLAPAEIEVLPDGRGRPIIHCPELEAMGEAPAVSLAHAPLPADAAAGRGSVAVAAVASHGRVGVDVEIPDARRLGDWLASAFHPDDLHLAPDADTQLVFWAAKEAAAKAAGLGFEGQPQAWRIEELLQESPTRQAVSITHQGVAYPVTIHTLPSHRPDAPYPADQPADQAMTKTFAQNGGALFAICHLPAESPRPTKEEQA